MNFGKAWQGFMGECDKDTAFGMMDYFFENGELRIQFRYRYRITFIDEEKVAISLTRRTITKAKSPKNGLASGIRREETETS